jgi:hypothetical protein
LNDKMPGNGAAEVADTRRQIMRQSAAYLRKVACEHGFLLRDAAVVATQPGRQDGIRDEIRTKVRLLGASPCQKWRGRGRRFHILEKSW